MAMMDCPECQKRISDAAEACPGCGHPIKKSGPKTANRESSGRGSGCAIVVLIGVVLAVLSSLFGDDKPRQPSPEEVDTNLRRDAIYTCEQFARKRMLDPDAAKFDRSEPGAVIVEGSLYTVLLTGRGKNAFGAYIPTGFRCQVTKDNKYWTLNNLQDLMK